MKKMDIMKGVGGEENLEERQSWLPPTWGRPTSQVRRRGEVRGLVVVRVEFGGDGGSCDGCCRGGGEVGCEEKE